MQWAEGGSLDDFIDARLGRRTHPFVHPASAGPSAPSSPGASPSPTPEVNLNSRSARIKAFRALPPGLTLSPARPKLGKVLSGVVDRSAALFSGRHERRRGGGGLTGVIVGVCGPAGLGDDVRRAVAEFDPKRRKTIGGIELHEE